MTSQHFRFTRREALKAGLLGAVAAGAGFILPGRPGSGAAAAAGMAPFQAPLPIPSVLTPARTDATTDYYTLTMQAGRRQILPGNSTPIWGYNGQFPGPTIRAQAGRTVNIHAINALGEATVIHLHGGHTPAGADGHPRDAIAPGGARDYVYPNNQTATTLWYHDHADGLTGKHVYLGLAGFYLISDPAEQALNLPGGQYDVPLLIQDRLFNADNSFSYPAQAGAMSGMMGGMGGGMGGGVQGNTILVNGAVQPYFQVAARRYRLRFLNGSNARIYELARSDGRPLVQIASDGGLLPQAVTLPAIVLAPGERAEVVVDFSAVAAGTSITLVNRRGSGSTAQILRFDVGGRVADDSALPAALRPITPLDTAGALRRTWVLGPGSDGWTINGLRYDMNRIDAQVTRGATEIWTFQNRSMMLHPMHVHDVQFQILSRSGGTIPANERGWKDTVQVNAMETVQVIARFADYSGTYVFHCHILEHEDSGMMAQFNVS